MSYEVLAMLAAVLTLTMFVTREAMLGFPCVIMWAILGGYAYTESTATWDIDYLLFFAAAFGMTVFCTLAAYGLREKRDTPAETEIEEGEGEYIDEGKREESDDEDSDEPKMSRQTKAIRERARKRREATSKRQSRRL